MRKQNVKQMVQSVASATSLIEMRNRLQLLFDSIDCNEGDAYQTLKYQARNIPGHIPFFSYDDAHAEFYGGDGIVISWNRYNFLVAERYSYGWRAVIVDYKE